MGSQLKCHSEAVSNNLNFETGNLQVIAGFQGSLEMWSNAETVIVQSHKFTAAISLEYSFPIDV